MSNLRRRKLRNLMINTGFQGRLVALVLAFGALNFLLNGILFYFYVQKSYAIIFASVDVPSVLVQTLNGDLQQFGQVLLVLSLVVTLVVAVYITILTHRAAGAAYHIHRVINEIRSGNLGARVFLRKNDEFQDLASSFNEMVDGLQADKRE